MGQRLQANAALLAEGGASVAKGVPLAWYHCAVSASLQASSGVVMQEMGHLKTRWE